MLADGTTEFVGVGIGHFVGPAARPRAYLSKSLLASNSHSEQFRARPQSPLGTRAQSSRPAAIVRAD
jgi:hypothetical protein